MPQDTTVPNQYYFLSDTYDAPSGAEAISIPVGFYPGNRSWNGSVAYHTTNGTAAAGIDYSPVSGVLTWSGPAAQSFTIPIRATNRIAEATITLELTATESNCIITRSQATLILPATPPTLAISPDANGTIQLSWPDSFADYVVQSSDATGAGDSWTDLSHSIAQTNGLCTVQLTPSATGQLFRLRHTTQN